MTPLSRENLPRGAGNPSRPTVLVVDDEALIRWALGEGLSAAGFPVMEAATGAEARAVLNGRSSKPSVVLLDLRLPDVDDLSLLAEIRKRWPEVPVVVMTAHGTAYDEAEARRLGAVQFMGKPFDVVEVVHIVEAAWLEHFRRPPA